MYKIWIWIFQYLQYIPLSLTSRPPLSAFPAPPSWSLTDVDKTTSASNSPAPGMNNQGWSRMTLGVTTCYTLDILDKWIFEKISFQMMVWKCISGFKYGFILGLYVKCWGSNRSDSFELSNSFFTLLALTKISLCLCLLKQIVKTVVIQLPRK